ncbi:MAG: zinc-ribbon domain-containing protein [Blastocatellia bacterium]
MFCPRCATENRQDQKYCRNCGLSLPSVRSAMEGAVDEAAVSLTKDVDRLSGGATTLAVFALIALATAFFSKESAAINLILGLIIGGPMIYLGMRGATRAIERMGLRPPESAAPFTPPALEAPRASPAEIPVVPDTGKMAPLAPPGSIAEHTTFELKRPPPS